MRRRAMRAVSAAGVAAVLVASAMTTAVAQPAAAPDQAARSGSPAASTAPAAPALGPVPARSDTAMEAYGKLNRDHASYLTRDDLRQLQGFESSFQQADQNGDGRLNPAEFNSAWSRYTGSTP